MEEQHNYEFNTSLEFEPIFFNTNTSTVNIDEVKQWLLNPMKNHDKIRRLSRRLFNSNGIYNNVVNRTVALPTLDRVVYSANRSHSRFKKNKEKYYTALRKMNDQILARNMMRKAAVDGESFYYLVTKMPNLDKRYMTDEEVREWELNADFNCSAIPLPTDYCKIVGIKNSSYVVAFDCSYFDQFTLGRTNKLKRYPSEIRRAYKEYHKNKSKRWAVLDHNRTLTLKIRSAEDEQHGRPLGMPAFVDMLYDSYYIETKRNILDDVNTTLIYQTFPEGKEKGQSALTLKQQQQQHDNIKEALFSKGSVKGVKFLSVAAGTKLDTLDTDVEFLKVKSEDELIKRITTNFGFAASALNGIDGTNSSQKSNIEMISAEVFTWLEVIQSEINKVINANIIQDPQVYMELHYLRTTHVNRKETVQHMKELYTNGAGSLQAWVAATGFSPEAYLALMDEEIEAGFDEKYKPHATSYTMSGLNNEDKTKSIDNDSDNDHTIKNKNTDANPVD